MTVPGSEIAVTHQGGEDFPGAIKAAFDAADRRLEEFARLTRQSMKGSKRRPKRNS